MPSLWSDRIVSLERVQLHLADDLIHWTHKAQKRVPQVDYYRHLSATKVHKLHLWLEGIACSVSKARGEALQHIPVGRTREESNTGQASRRSWHKDCSCSLPSVEA